MPYKRRICSLGRLLPAAGRDEGIALATVVAMSAILFLLATTLIMVATQQQVMTSAYVARNKALQVADAGITAYLYQLRYDSAYASTHPSMGPIATTEGSWTVIATQESSGSPVTLRSIGEIPSLGAKRTIVSTVRFPSFSDYMIVMNTSYQLSSPFKIIGKVYSCGDVTNDGEITGHVYAKGKVWGHGVFGDGYTEDCLKPLIDFSTIQGDMTPLHNTAAINGTNFSASGGLGYRVILNGTVGTYQKVTAVNGTTGALTLSGPVMSFTIAAPPTLAILFFEDRVWIDGVYSRSVTVVSNYGGTDNLVDPSYGHVGGDKGSFPYANSAFFIVGSLMPSDVNGAMVCGLVTPGDISIPIWYDTISTVYGSSTSPQFRVWAAMISQNGTLHCDNDGWHHVRDFYLRGSRTAQYAGNFTGVDSSSMEYDVRLEQRGPPLFPTFHDGSMTVDSWIEN